MQLPCFIRLSCQLVVIMMICIFYCDDFDADAEIPHQIWAADSLVGLMMLVLLLTMIMVMMLLLMTMMMLLMLMMLLMMLLMLMPLMPTLMPMLPTTLSQSFASSHPVDCPQSPSNLQFTCHKSHFSSSNVCNFHLSHFIVHSSAVTSHKSKSQVTCHNSPAYYSSKFTQAWLAVSGILETVATHTSLILIKTIGSHRR